MEITKHIITFKRSLNKKKRFKCANKQKLAQTKNMCSGETRCDICSENHDSSVGKSKLQPPLQCSVKQEIAPITKAVKFIRRTPKNSKKETINTVHFDTKRCANQKEV